MSSSRGNATTSRSGSTPLGAQRTPWHRSTLTMASRPDNVGHIRPHGVAGQGRIRARTIGNPLGWSVRRGGVQGGHDDIERAITDYRLKYWTQAEYLQDAFRGVWLVLVRVLSSPLTRNTSQG